MRTTFGPLPVARLADSPLPALDPRLPPWPSAPVLLGGHALAVRHTPPTRSGVEPALYVHGLGGSATNWTDLAALLAGRFDGEAVDLPGFGDSDPAPDGDYSLDASAHTLARLVEQRGRGPVHLLGNSLGGAVSVVLAALRPDLVRTLTLISPAMPDLRPRPGPALLVGAFAMPGLRGVAHRYSRRAGLDERVREVVAVCFADPSLVPPWRLAEAVEEARRRERQPWAEEAFARSVRGLVASYVSRGPASLWARAAAVAAPTLVVWGGEDRLVDVALAGRTARTIPRSQLLVLPRVGHTAHLEAPEVVARAVLAHVS